jgi:nucleoside-diphosphate-sugar epimerase
MRKKYKILVTGGAGYIGSMLVTELVHKGYDITVLDKLNYSVNSLSHLFSYKNFNLIIGDVNNSKLIEKVVKNNEIIIPLAGLVGAPLCEKFPKLAKKVNYDSILHLIKILKKKQKIIFPNTNSGYGTGKKENFCTEESPLNPISLYGMLKKKAENEVLKYKNCVVFRLATVFGFSYRMRTDLLVNNFVYFALRNKKLKIFEPQFRRNFIHVKDVVNAFIFAIENFKKMRGNIYNLGLSTANFTKLQLANEIKKNIKKLKIYRNYKKSDPDKRDYFVNNNKIERLGFKTKFSIQDGIIELIKVFRLGFDKKIKNNY